MSNKSVSVQLALMQVSDAIKGARLLAEMHLEPQLPCERDEQNAVGAIAAILSLTALHTDNLLRFMRSELPDTSTIRTPANAMNEPLADLDLVLDDDALPRSQARRPGSSCRHPA